MNLNRVEDFVLFGSLTEEAPDGEVPGLLPLLKKERHDDGRETITTGSNYHLARINRPALNEKRALTAGCQGSSAPLKRESIG